MKNKDQQLLEEAYAFVSVNKVYYNTNLRNIFPEEIWNTNSLEAKRMFVEAFGIGQRAALLEEGILSNIGKTLLTPLQAAGKIYSSIITPINSFVEKYGYEKTGLKEIDQATYNSVINKFDQFLDKLDPKAADFIRTSLKEAQSFVKGNPIKMSLLSVALTTAMSFAGAPMLAIFAAACLVRGTIGLLKGETPIKSFGKSLLVGVVGKVIGLAGKEILHHFGVGDHSHSLKAQPDNVQLQSILDQIKHADFSSTTENIVANKAPGLEPISRELNSKYLEKLLQYKDKPISVRKMLTDIWKDMGLSDRKVEKLLNNSFKNNDLVHVDLDRMSRFIFYDDAIVELKSDNPFKIMSTILHSIAKAGGGTKELESMNNWAEMMEIPNINGGLSPRSSEVDFLNLLIKFNQDGATADALLPALRSKCMEFFTKDSNKLGFTFKESDIYFLKNDVSDFRSVFRQVAGHEALHTAQHSLYPEKVRHVLQDLQDKQDLDDPAGEWNQYLLRPNEFQTWAGNIKRAYFQDTGILINNESTDKDIEKLFTWAYHVSPRSPHIDFARAAARLDELTKHSAEAKKLLKDQLRDVAVNDSTKKVSNIA